MHINVKFFNVSILKSLQLFAKPSTDKTFSVFYSYRYIYYNRVKMPKDEIEINALKNNRIKKKKQVTSVRFPPGEIYLSVLGNGSKSSPRSLYMFTDHERYLFNCGEGTQRLASEHKLKLSKLDNIFLTHKSWDNIGGLFGLSLTLQDMGVPEITLHGLSDLDLLFEDARSFVHLKSLEITTKSYIDEKFSDNCMDVIYIPIFKNSSASNFQENSCGTDYSDNNANHEDDSPFEPRPKKLCTSNSDMKQDMVVAYVCKGKSKPGTLLYEKCAKLGVPIGPLLGDLKNGKDVILPSGKIVLSKDVVSEAQHCPIFLVVECPNMEFLKPFVEEKKFDQYQKNSSEAASLIVHFTSPNIINTPDYQQWMAKFLDSTCHLILNSDNATLNSLAVHRIQHKLNLLHPGIFNLLHESEVADSHVSKRANVIQASTLERYYLRPSKGLDRNTALKFDPKDFVDEALETEGFTESLKNLKADINSYSNVNINKEQYPVVSFLGTGGSIPSKARNVSSILVNISKEKYMLLDCGEGTYNQLVRLYGDQHEKVLEHLRYIFISHIHADHHLGLVNLLKAREEVFKKLSKEHKHLILIGPTELKWWLKSYHKIVAPITYLYRFFDCSSLEHNHLKTLERNAVELNQNIQISTVPVIHCADAHGVIIDVKDPKWKLVYSGDTMPCERLVEAGENCTVLIHEATMEDELKDEAEIKKHSTTSQAIKIGEDMKSSYTILTHFSQRYAKIPLFNENFHNHVGCAFDNMTVSSSDLYVLPLLIPALKCLFAEEVEDMNIRGNKRRRKLETINLFVDKSVANEL